MVVEKEKRVGLTKRRDGSMQGRREKEECWLKDKESWIEEEKE